jgi:hypothetical protein
LFIVGVERVAEDVPVTDGWASTAVSRVRLVVTDGQLARLSGRD